MICQNKHRLWASLFSTKLRQHVFFRLCSKIQEQKNNFFQTNDFIITCVPFAAFENLRLAIVKPLF